MTRLKVKAPGTFKDYFFPWVNRGVGEVRVPRNAPERTIVATNGMNGCALVVTQVDTDLIFYHDGNDAYLSYVGSLKQSPRKQAEGTVVCVVKPKDYDRLNIGFQAADEAGKLELGEVYVVQLLVIRDRGKWKVFTSSFMIGPGIDMMPRRKLTTSLSSFNVSFDG